eukprot:TRINITY_DN12249_c0_g1_i1.p2 TRINITY_DN12249_c0_g1~~TRINITY_DN12249_c0_g1_i1.p2  ORF type:complete len:119 (+),score=25.46 TRINITY_DN12249_c0_g1_i1:1118-1474(+)
MNSTFGLVPEGTQPHTYRIMELLEAGSIPVIVSSDFKLPLSDVVRWDEFSFHVPVEDIGRLPDMLRAIPRQRVLRMRQKANEAFQKYFRTWELSLQWGLEVVRSRIHLQWSADLGVTP